MRCTDEKFVDLGSPRRVWAVSALHGDLSRLVALHDHLATRFALGDRIVYLGNYLGVGSSENEKVLEELLAFRAALLAKPGMEPSDIVHLRGPAEEAWQRLLRLQFAPLPMRSIEPLVEAGIEPYLRLYGVGVADARAIARGDSMAITRWTNQLRVAQRMSPGHEPLLCSTRRAAVTTPPGDAASSLLFVPAGYDVAKSLEDQGDSFWFAKAPFESPEDSRCAFAHIVRGLDPMHAGVRTDGRMMTLDGGCGFGGPLMCGCFMGAGRLAEMVAIGGAYACAQPPGASFGKDSDSLGAFCTGLSSSFQESHLGVPV